MPQSQKYTDTFIIIYKLFLVGLQGLYFISNPDGRSCSSSREAKNLVQYFDLLILKRSRFRDLRKVQVNLFQKSSFLHQLTHNMTRDCSLNFKKNTGSQVLNVKTKTKKQFCTQHVVNLYFSWKSMNNLSS